MWNLTKQQKTIITQLWIHWNWENDDEFLYEALRMISELLIGWIKIKNKLNENKSDKKISINDKLF